MFTSAKVIHFLETTKCFQLKDVNSLNFFDAPIKSVHHAQKRICIFPRLEVTSHYIPCCVINVIITTHNWSIFHLWNILLNLIFIEKRILMRFEPLLRYFPYNLPPNRFKGLKGGLKCEMDVFSFPYSHLKLKCLFPFVRVRIRALILIFYIFL